MKTNREVDEHFLANLANA